MRATASSGTPGQTPVALDLVQIQDEAGLRALRHEWNALLQSSCSNNLFLTWEWVSTWWRIYGDGSRLRVLAARSPEGRLVGVAPLKSACRKVLGLWVVEVIEFIGHGGDVTPEYLDFIVEPKYEVSVVSAFAAWLCADPGVRVLDLRPFAAQSPNLERLERALAEGGGRLRRFPDSVCPILPLPSSTEEFVAGRTRNYRKKVRESERRCERDLAVRLRVSASAEEIVRDLQLLADLHHKRWDGRSRAFQSPQYLEFHQQLSRVLLERGWVRLFTLESRSTPIALLYCFAYADRYYFYQAGRDPRYARHRVGLVLMHKVIQEAIRERAKVFDFLRGEEDYKYHWASSNAKNVRLVYSKTLPGRTAARGRALVDVLLRSLPHRRTSVPSASLICRRNVSTG